MLDPSRDVLLLDGDCGLCHRLARFMDLKLVPRVDNAYRPIESEDAQNLIATFPKWHQQSDTIYLPLQVRLFLCQIGCSDTMPALHDMVLEDVVSDPLDNPITNT